TNTPETVQAIFQDVLVEEGVGKATFENSGDVHQWSFTLTSNDVISLSVAPAINDDIRITVKDNDGNTLATQNNAGAGQVEFLRLPINTPGDYDVYVEEINGNTNSYAVLLLLNTSFNFVLEEATSYGSTVNGSLPPDTDHFISFYGNTGDIITIELTPDANSNILFMLYDDEMTLINNQTYSTGVGETRSLVDFELTRTGLFTIRIGEFNYEDATYTLYVTN
ncbi:MAG TPA: hypothetical protein VLL52_00460, partial [Anaerolineae bacterium]|nr:hypothetical protein [Anaerolineae bacterium]